MTEDEQLLLQIIRSLSETQIKAVVEHFENIETLKEIATLLDENQE